MKKKIRKVKIIATSHSNFTLHFKKVPLKKDAILIQCKYFNVFNNFLISFN